MTDRRRRKEITIYGILLFFLLLILLLFSTRVNKITVLGNKQYTEKELTKMILTKELDYNSFYAFIKDKIRPHKTIPFVEKYELHWKDPFALEIIVYEKNMVGYVEYMSSNHFFVGDGTVVESTK